MKLTNGWGQEIRPDWIRGKLTLDSIHANLLGLQRLEVSRATARKLAGFVPRCGYETLAKMHEPHEGHIKKTYLTNVSNSQYYFWSYESPCISCHQEQSQ